MDNRDPFSSLVRRWSAPELPPGRLQQEVWRRIAHRETEELTWWARVQGWFAQPAFVGAFVACCVLVGLFVAEVRVTRAQHAQQLALARDYVAAIDPLLAEARRP